MSSSIMQYLMQLSQQPRPVPQAPIPQPPQQTMPTPLRPSVRGSAPGILSKFGDAVRNTLAPNPGEQVQGLIGQDAIKAAQSQALLSLGASLLSNSGWSQRPVTLGEALGKGLQASQATYGQSINTAVDNATNARNASSWEEQRRAQADASQELARQRATERFRDEAIARARPEYAALLSGMDGLTPDQKYARYSQIQDAALKVSDMEVVKQMETAKNMLLQYQQKDVQPKYNYETYRGETKVYKDGQLVRTDGRRDPTGEGGGTGGGAGAGGTGVNGTKNVAGPMGRVDKAVQTVTMGVEGLAASQQRFVQNATNPMNQIATLYDFIRMRDNSTVRDGERKMVTDANSLLGRVGLSVAALQSGQVMTRKQMEDMLGIMKSEIEAKRKALETSTRMDRAFLRRPETGMDLTAPDSVLTTPTPWARGPAPAPRAGLPARAAAPGNLPPFILPPRKP